MLIFKSDAAKTLSDWSRDGKYLAYVSNNDVWALPLSRDPKPVDPKAGLSAGASAEAGELKPIQVTKTTFSERLPRISPDSRWIAYVSNKSGATEVYVQSFPEPGIEQQVSTGVIEGGAIGGGQLRWSRDGTELSYYTTNPQRFMRVAVKPAGTSLNAAAPALLFPHPAPRQPFSSVFSVTTDGRFLIPVRPAAVGGVGVIASAASIANPAAAAPVMVIVNWAAGK
jgi:Tol biopolymer transport system component